jgi:hypothetical protein
MDDIAVNNISYHQLIMWIQNAVKPTNFAVAVQEFGNEILSLLPGLLAVGTSRPGYREIIIRSLFSDELSNIIYF